MIKKIIIIVLLAQATLGFSQKKLKLEYNSGFYTKFLFDSDVVTTNNSYHGASVGLSYAIHLKPKWGVETGLLFSSYNTSISLNKKNLKSLEVDDRGSGFVMNLKTKGYKESVGMCAIEIPIRLFFDNANDDKKIGYYGALGGKFIQPIYQKGVIKANSISVSGFYPDINVTIDDLPNHGFGTWENFKEETTPDFGSTFVISAELGISFKIDEDRFYLGLFADYGLSNLNRNKKSTESLIDYNRIGKPKRSGGASNLKSTKSIKMLSLGLQIKYWFL